MQRLKLDEYGIHEVCFKNKMQLVLYANFERDYYTWKSISIVKVKRHLKKKGVKKNNFYLSEIADGYYQKKYGKNILEVLDEYYDIPRCSKTGLFLSYSCFGFIVFGKYGVGYVWNKGLTKNDNDSVRKIAESKIGEKNPMYGILPWNKDLTKENSLSVKSVSDKMKGRALSNDHKNKLSKSALERVFHGHTGCKHSDNTKIKISLAKGGNGDLKRLKDRKRIIWDDIKWRDFILLRDLYTCVVCGKGRSVQAHHIKPKAKYPKLRYDKENGITLCFECHKKIYQNEEKYETKFYALVKNQMEATGYE